MDREKLIYKTNKNTYNFKNFQTIRTFGDDIYNGEITLEEANKSQEKLMNEIDKFNKRTRPKNDEKKAEK